MEKSEFEAQCMGSSGPGLGLIRKITDTFEITLDDFIGDQIDEEWIRAPKLSNEFTASDGSKFRTSLPVLRWLEKNYGNDPVQTILRKLKIPKDVISDPNCPVKLRLLCQLLRAVKSRGIDDQAIFEMGMSAFNISENTVIRNNLAHSRTPEEAFDYFFHDLIDRFERNFIYKIEKVESNSVLIRATAREERILENGISIIADPSLSVYRWGVGAGILNATKFDLLYAEPVRMLDENNATELFRFHWHTENRHAAAFSGERPRLKLL